MKQKRQGHIYHALTLVVIISLIGCKQSPDSSTATRLAKESQDAEAVHEEVIPPLGSPERVTFIKTNLEGGFLLLSRHNFRGARAAFERVVTADADNAIALNNLGLLEVHDNYPEAAMSLFSKSLARSTNVVVGDFSFILVVESDGHAQNLAAFYPENGDTSIVTYQRIDTPVDTLDTNKIIVIDLRVAMMVGQSAVFPNHTRRLSLEKGVLANLNVTKAILPKPSQ